MDKEMKLFELVPLQCTRCNARISSGRSDRVFFCDNCGIALEYNGEKLTPVDTHCAKPVLDTEHEPELFLPFWSFRLAIKVEGKSVYLPLFLRDNSLMQDTMTFNTQSFVQEVLRKRKEHTLEGETDFTVYVPSFPTTGAYTLSSELGIRFTKQQPVLSFYRENKRVESCIYNEADALAIAEDEYISLQAAVIPNLLALDLSIQVMEKTIIGVPYMKKEKGIYYDQIIGEMLLANALMLEERKKERR